MFNNFIYMKDFYFLSILLEHLILIVGKKIKELLIAAEMGDVEIIRNIVKAIEQFDIKQPWLTQCDKKGRTPLHLAAICGYINVVRFLVTEILDKTPNEELRKQHLNIADHKGRTSLFHAAAENRVQVVRFLAERGADLEIATNDNHNEPGSTALMACAEKGHSECFQIILEKGANILAIRNDGADATYIAARYGHVPIIEEIAGNRKLEQTGKIKLIVDRPTFRSRSALLTAAYHGHIKVCKILHRKGANLDHQDEDSFTALIYAASEGFFDLVKWLVERGADMYLRNKFGETASMFAEANGYSEVARFLSKWNDDGDASTELINGVREMRIKLERTKHRASKTLSSCDLKLTRKSAKKIGPVFVTRDEA